MSNGIDDHALVQRCRDGHTESFGELVRRHEARLFPTVARLIGCPEQARDVLQDAFVQAFEKLDRFQGGSSFYTWMYRIAVNAALTGRRRRKPSLSLHRGDSETQAIDPAEPVEQTDPGTALEREEQDRLIRAAIDALHDDHRAVVILKDLEDKSYEEIAETLDIAIGTVRSRLHRARQELRRRLAPLLEESQPPSPPLTANPTAAPSPPPEAKTAPSRMRTSN